MSKKQSAGWLLYWIHALKKNGFQQSSNSKQASTFFKHELANFAFKDSALRLPVVKETCSQNLLLNFLVEQSENKLGNTEWMQF